MVKAVQTFLFLKIYVKMEFPGGIKQKKPSKCTLVYYHTEDKMTIIMLKYNPKYKTYTYGIVDITGF